MVECSISIAENYYTIRFCIKNGSSKVVRRVIGIQDFMHGYNYIIVCVPLWLSHSGAKGVGRKGCLKRVVPSHSVDINGCQQQNHMSMSSKCDSCIRYV